MKRRKKGSLSTRLYFELKAKLREGLKQVFISKSGEVIRVYTICPQGRRNLALKIDKRPGKELFPINHLGLDSRVLRDLPNLEET
jgi:hypothetical protein